MHYYLREKLWGEDGFGDGESLWVFDMYLIAASLKYTYMKHGVAIMNIQRQENIFIISVLHNFSNTSVNHSLTLKY